MTYRVIIADDEMLARKRLRMMLETKPEYAILAECADGT
jgi:DNA-binding NarL/FixJ family response regulator